MASGMAVVSFDCPSGPADMIEHGKNGLLVTAGHKVEFVKQLRRLMDDVELRERLGQEAVKIQETLAIEKIAQRWNQIIIPQR